MFNNENEKEDLSEAIQTECRCAECCRRLLIEVGLNDAAREPKIKELGSPLYAPAEVTDSGQPTLEAYRLNAMPPEDRACVFLDKSANLCTIYETRPDVCRAFDCDGEGKEQLIELGYKPGAPYAERTIPKQGRSR